MNAITKCLSDAKFRIPNEILYLAFMERSEKINTVISLDEMIMNKVIRPRVLTDCNLVGGIMTRVDISKCNVTVMANREFIVEVPKSLTANRSIVSVLGLVSNVIYHSSTAFNETPSALATGLNMVNNLSSENVIQTSRLELIGDNTVLVQDPTIHLINSVLRCMVENDSKLSNIKPRSYPALSKLFTLAIKSYIYNHLIVKLDQGFIQGGHELGVISNIITDYAEAEAEYQEYLATVVTKLLYMNDADQFGRHVKSMLGNTL